MAHTVNSVSEAWLLANKLFPTDYAPDVTATKNAGYPIYWSTAYGVNAWISDLGCTLELNMPDASTIRINIVSPVTTATMWDYNGQY